MGSELTPKFDQEALQRILQRAAELQADERDVSGSLDGSEVLALGRDWRLRFCETCDAVAHDVDRSFDAAQDRNGDTRIGRAHHGTRTIKCIICIRAAPGRDEDCSGNAQKSNDNIENIVRQIGIHQSIPS